MISRVDLAGVDLTGASLGGGIFEEVSLRGARLAGATLREFDVSSIDTSFLPLPNAWAFAYWGGRYYIFYLGALGTSSSIFRLTPDTGAVEVVIPETGYRIVGAGVSTCAPTILI